MCISTVYSVSKLIFFISEIRALRFFFGGVSPPLSWRWNFRDAHNRWTSSICRHCWFSGSGVLIPTELLFLWGILEHTSIVAGDRKKRWHVVVSLDTWRKKEIKDMIPLLEFKKCLIISGLTCHLRSCSWSPSEAWNAWVVYIVSCMSWHHWHSLHSCHPQLHVCHFPYGSALPLEAALSTKPKDSRVDWWHIIEYK